MIDMAENIKIGESEWYVMKALWENAPLSGAQIVERLSRETDWSQSTIYTMIRRLHQKGAICAKKEEVTLYSPVVTQEEAERQEASSFVKRVYEGSVQMMVQGFLKDNRLTQQDIRELKKLLEEREGK
jgi:BlaI family penicillinase repressor